MLSRVTLLVTVFGVMAAGGFTLGRTSADGGQPNEIGVPPEHPVSIALELRTELKLRPEQASRLEDIRAGLARRLEPFQRRAKELERRAAELKRSGGDPQARAQLESEMKELHQTLEGQVPSMMAKAAEEVVQVLDQEQRESLHRVSQARSAKSGSHDLLLIFIMEHREQLGVTPQQFTKLQYLQADLIRAFAPVREQIELLQFEMRKTVEETQKEPPAQLVQRMRSLEEQVAKLKEHVSNRSIQEVLNAEQRTKLHELLRESTKSHGGR